MKKNKTKKKKLGFHHRVHRHIKKHLGRLKRKKPHAHKALVLMSIALPLVLGTVLFGSSALYLFESYQNELLGMEKEKITVEVPVAEDDTLAWKTYQDKITGFSVKYPDYWPDPKVSRAGGKVEYLEKVVFDNGFGTEAKRFKGFEVYVYDAEKISGPVESDNLMPKNPENLKANDCDKSEFSEATLGEGAYPAQEVEVESGDRCFMEAYFFSVNRGKYFYNIVPLAPETDSPLGEGKKIDVITNFPKFFEILSTFVVPLEEVQIEEEKEVIQKNIVEKKVQPRRVLQSLGRCSHKNDHPRKSRTKKHRHMDEDCCMDPDEWPNPRCQY